ncbi:salicylate hydroxylase [Cryptococcus neoformans Bt1]|nr:salicylate hydroxylase [Cryptococcus neoformans var. grubii Bt1]OXG35319.1 salicylate hydroxylase [Cryptococcus neoformans var. grubii Ze90-1]
MTITSQQKRVKVGVIGAGPGGLAIAINLLKLPFIDLNIYDQATELREVGAGISINQNTWRHLQLLGAADTIEQFTIRGDGSKIDIEQRNGRTGELLLRKYQSVNPNAPVRSRIERHKLQRALLGQMPENFIKLSKKLETVVESDDGVIITFKDGAAAGPFDLLIGADGIRSVVRQYAYPEHRLSYTGKVAYRTLIPQSKIAHIANIPHAATFWHTAKSHVYTDRLDNGLFEIATRAIESEEHGNKVSWGQKVSRDRVIHHYKDYCETIRQIIEAPEEWLEFAMFGGPRLDSVIHNGRIALIGDASHPLSGAFGSGAAFAFEDAYVLAQALAYTHSRDENISEALKLYDEVRSPHYKGLYAILSGFADTASEVQITYGTEDEDQFVRETIRRNWSTNQDWIYSYDVTKVWYQRVVEEDGKKGVAELKIGDEQGINLAADARSVTMAV